MIRVLLAGAGCLLCVNAVVAQSSNFNEGGSSDFNRSGLASQFDQPFDRQDDDALGNGASGSSNSSTRNSHQDNDNGLTEPTPPRLGVLLSNHATHGVLVREVSPDTPADHAGLRSGDRIVMAGGRHVFSNADLTQIVRQNGGRPFSLTVLRDGRAIDLEADLQPADEQQGHPGDRQPEGRKALGIFIEQSHDGSVRVSDVIPGGPAEHAGVRRGDRILAVGNRVVRRAEDVEETLNGIHPQEDLALHLDRNGEFGTLWVHAEPRAEVMSEAKR